MKDPCQSNGEWWPCQSEWKRRPTPEKAQLGFDSPLKAPSLILQRNHVPPTTAWTERSVNTELMLKSHQGTGTNRFTDILLLCMYIYIYIYDGIFPYKRPTSYGSRFPWVPQVANEPQYLTNICPSCEAAAWAKKVEAETSWGTLQIYIYIYLFIFINMYKYIYICLKHLEM